MRRARPRRPCCPVAQPPEQGQEGVDVLRVQPDRGLVEYVERVHQARAQGVGEGDALGFAPRQRPHLPAESQVAESDIDQKAHPRREFPEDCGRDGGLHGAEFEPRQPAGKFVDGQIVDTPDVEPPTETWPASGRSLEPPQARQRNGRWYRRRKMRMYGL